MNNEVIELVNEAIKLQAIVKEHQIHLEEIKSKLREYAKKDTHEGEKVTYRTSAGSAEIVFISPSPKLKAGANPHSLIGSVLDEGTWEHLFHEQTKIVLSKDFEAAVKLLKTAQQKEVNRLIEIETPEPRVSIK